MKTVFKCDYCSQTKDEAGDMSAHEDECQSNPDKKSCYTCKNHIDEGAPISGPMYTCAVKAVEWQGEWEDFLNNCSKWEADD